MTFPRNDQYFPHYCVPRAAHNQQAFVYHPGQSNFAVLPITASSATNSRSTFNEPAAQTNSLRRPSRKTTQFLSAPPPGKLSGTSHPFSRVSSLADSYAYREPFVHARVFAFLPRFSQSFVRALLWPPPLCDSLKTSPKSVFIRIRARTHPHRSRVEFLPRVSRNFFASSSCLPFLFLSLARNREIEKFPPRRKPTHLERHEEAARKQGTAAGSSRPCPSP